MLSITIPKKVGWDTETNKFVDLPAVKLPPLEHSLIAISKWEAKYQVPFLKNIQTLATVKHIDKFFFYVNCMSTKGEIDPELIGRLSEENIKDIAGYIGDPHTATVPSASRGKPGGKVVTAERIYAQMAGYGIPHEYARWHLNNLLMVIDICRENNEDPKERQKGDPSSAAAFYEQNERLRKAGKAL